MAQLEKPPARPPDRSPKQILHANLAAHRLAIRRRRQLGPAQAQIGTA
jgi:hypothetical protein